MLIRSMESHDLDQVSELCRQLGYFPTLTELQSRHQKLSQLKSHRLLVAANDDVIVGFTHLEIVQDLIEEEKVEIKALVVRQDQRRNSVGKALILETIKWARSVSVSAIYLSCNTLRKEAHLFYETQGFNLIKTSSFFELKIS